MNEDIAIQTMSPTKDARDLSRTKSNNIER